MSGYNVYGGIDTRRFGAKNPIITINTGATDDTNRSTFLAQYISSGTKYSGLTRSTDGTGWFLFKDYSGTVDQLTGSGFAPSGLTADSLTIAALGASGDATVGGSLSVAGTSNLFSASTGTFQVNQPSTFANNVTLTSATAKLAMTNTTAAASSFITLNSAALYTSGGLAVNLTSYLNGATYLNAGVDVNGASAFHDGAMTVASTAALTVNSSATFNASVTTNGALSLGNYSLTTTTGTTSPFVNIGGLSLTNNSLNSDNYFITIQAPALGGSNVDVASTLFLYAPALQGLTTAANRCAIVAETGNIYLNENVARLAIPNSTANPANATDYTNASLWTNGGAIINHDAYIGGDGHVVGALTSGGNLSSSGTLAVTGATTLTGALTINDVTSPTGTPPANDSLVSLYSAGGANIQKKLYLGQDATINGGAYVNGLTKLAAGAVNYLDVSNTGVLTVRNTSNLADTNISGTTTVTGTSSIQNTMTFASGSGIATTSMTNDFDFSNSTGAFKTTTGPVSINGDTTIAAGHDLTFAAGAGNLVHAAGAGGFDFSLATGTFKTSTGVNSLNGNVQIAAGKSVTFLAGAGGLSVGATSTGNFDFSGSGGTFATTTGAVTLGGTGTVTFGTGAGYSIATAATTGSADFSSMTGNMYLAAGAGYAGSAFYVNDFTQNSGVYTATFGGSSFTVNNGAIALNPTTLDVVGTAASSFGSLGTDTGSLTVWTALTAKKTPNFETGLNIYKTLDVGMNSATDTLLNDVKGVVFRVHNDYHFTLAADLTGHEAFVAIDAPQITSGAFTASNASSLYIAGPPAASGGATITNAFALFVAAGLSRFVQNVSIGGTLTVDTTSTLAATTVSNLTVTGTADLQGALTSRYSNSFLFNTTLTGTGDIVSPFFNVGAATYSLTSGSSPVNFVTIQGPQVTTNTSSKATTFYVAAAPTGATVAHAIEIGSGDLYLSGASSSARITNTGTAAASTSAFDATASLSTAGGLSVGGNAFITSTLNLGDALTIATGGLSITAGSSSIQDLTAAGDVHINSGTDAVDSGGNTGSLATDGGASIAKKLYVGTGFTVSAGGASITGNSTVTGTLTVTSSLTAQGAIIGDSTLDVTGDTTLTGAATLHKGLFVDYATGPALSGTGMASSSLFNVSGTTYNLTSGTGDVYFTTFGTSDVTGGSPLNAATVYIAAAPTGTATNPWALMVGSGSVYLANANSVLHVDGTSDASEAAGASGAIRTAGGASIAKKLYVGSTLNVTGVSNLASVNMSGNSAVTGSATFTVGTGATSLGGTLGVTGATTLAGILHSNNVTDVSNYAILDTAACVSLSGGLSVAKKINALDLIRTSVQFYSSATADAAAYTDTTASIYTAGGAAITKALAVGGNLSVQGSATITGDMTVTGTLTTTNSQTLDVSNHIVVANSGLDPSVLPEDSGFVGGRKSTNLIINSVDVADRITTTLNAGYVASSTTVVIVDAFARALDYYKGWVIAHDPTGTPSSASIATSAASVPGTPDTITLTLDAALSASGITSGDTVYLYPRRLVGMIWDETDNALSAYAFPRDVAVFDPAATDGSAPKRADINANKIHAYSDLTVDGNLNIGGSITVAPNPTNNSLITGSVTLTSSNVIATQNFFVKNDTADTVITLPSWTSLSPSVAASGAGVSYIVRITNISANSHTVTITPSSGDSIDGSTSSFVLETKYSKMTLMTADSGNWIVI